MPPRGNTLSGAASQLRQGATVRGRGWQTLVKPPQPAAATSFTRTTPAEYWERLLSLAFTLTTSAVAGVRTLALLYQDGDAYTFNLVPISNEISPSQTLTGYADLASVTPVQAPNSHEITASVTAPAAGGVIASLVLPAGGWTLSWIIQLAGTPAAADANNFQLRQGAAVLLGSVNPGAVGGPWTQTPIEVQIPTGGATVSVNANGAGTAGAIYTAQLVAVPASVFQLQVQIPDFILKSGWGLQLQLGNAQAGDQLSGLGLLLERFPSSDIDQLAGDPIAELASELVYYLRG